MVARCCVLAASHRVICAVLAARCPGYLDEWQGAVAWQTRFKVVVLRMISYNLDYHDAIRSPPPSFSTHRSSCAHCAQDEDDPCLAWRAQQPRPLADYSPLAYYVYLLYLPLRFSSPIITFNHFLSNVRSPHRMPLSAVGLYAARVCLAALTCC